MPARVANIAPCITQVTFKLVHYALLINQLRFGLTFFKVLGNFPTDKYGLDCGLELNAKVNCVLTMLAESWSLKGMTTRVTSFPANLPEACNGCWSVTLELIKVLMAELIRW